MTAKVWLVTTGEYSDYRVVSAFTTEELANSYAEHYPGSYGRGHAEVEEYDLCSELPALNQWTTLTTYVRADGSIHDQGASDVVEWHWADEKPSLPARAQVNAYNGGYIWSMEPAGRPLVGVTTEGTDHERVRKVHCEALAMTRAEAAIILAPNPEDADRPYPAPVNYRAAHKMNAELAKQVPWRVLLQANGYGMVATQLLHAGVDYEEATLLAWMVYEHEPNAERRVDELLGTPDA